jgi:predicted DNA-binding protein (UPF0251 family)
MTLQEASKRIGKSESTLRRAVKSGKKKEQSENQTSGNQTDLV